MKTEETASSLSNEDFLEKLKSIISQLIQSKMKSYSNSDALLDEKEAAEFFGLRPQTLALWRHQSTGPVYYKLGSAVRYDLKELKAYTQSQRVGR